MIKPHLVKSLFTSLILINVFSVHATDLKVKVENLTNSGGVFLTPLWVAFHDGSFDSYTLGEQASIGVERIAEDGNPADLRGLFASSSSGQDAVIFNPEGFAGAPIFEPGSSSTMVFDVDGSTQKYFSYANMVIPSNDAFVANDNPLEHQLFDENGDFVGPISFIVWGSQVLDAGTEENNESDAAFINQSAANTGNTTTENIAIHAGYNGSVTNLDATPVNILGGTVASGDVIDSAKGDFKTSNYQLMRITISENTVPVRVSIKNSAMTDGTFLTPFWVAFHDGTFDTYDLGIPASVGLEHMAEDGDSSVLSSEFAAQGNGIDMVVINPEGFAGAPLFDPGFSTQQVVNLDPAVNKYFSYVSMLLPSNDAFIGNADPKRYQIFDDNGNFTGGVNFKVYGSQVLDAGTEENTESDAAFFNQTAPNTGNTTSDNVSAHLGYNGSVGNPNGTPQVFLGNTNPPGFLIDQTKADFSIEGYQVVEIAISRLVDGSLSGSWYDPSRSGEGFVIDITDADNGEARAVVYWYTYNSDGSGAQAWVVGTGPVVADTIIADMTITDGTGFGASFDANDVNRTPWGQVRIKFDGCGSATVSYESLDSNYGSGSYPLQRITTGPVDYKGACSL
jgi:hypothetical protein